MIYFLLISLIILFLIIYFASNRELLNPSSIFVIMFLLGATVASIYANKWDIDINVKTYLVIIVALLAFFFGEFSSNRITLNMLKSPKRETGRKVFEYKRFNISMSWIIIICIIELVVLYFSFVYTYNLSVLAGNKYGLSQMLNFAYYAHYDPNIVYEQSAFLTLGLVFSNCFAYIMLYVFINNTVFSKFSLNDIKYFPPIIIYIAQIILATGRTKLFRIIIVILMLTAVMVKVKNNWSTKNNGKIIRSAILGLVIFFAIFRMYGLLRGSIASEWDQIISYIGKPIIALDNYIEFPRESKFFGSETLLTVYTILRKIGFEIPYNSIALEYTYWGDVSINIYTAFRRYINDFSIIGLIIIQYLMGFFYGYFYKTIRNGKIGIHLLLYSMFIYPVFESIFEERFFLGVISAGSVYTVVITIILYKLFLNPNVIKVIYKNSS